MKNTELEEKTRRFSMKFIVNALAAVVAAVWGVNKFIYQIRKRHFR